MSSIVQPSKEQPAARKKRRGRCLLSASVRERLLNKRKVLKLSQTAMARFFNVYWTTYRKWECGDTKFVSPDVYRLIEHLIADDFDEQLSTLQNCDECDDKDCLFHTIMPDTHLLDLFRKIIDADNQLKNKITLRKLLRTRMAQTLDEVLSLATVINEQ